MKTITKTLLAAAVTVASAFTASAQYYQLVNQATNMLQTALSGGANYRGTVDVSFVNGIGSKQARFYELSTTQGVKYGDIFFMGVGLGVDLMNTQVNTQIDNKYYQPDHPTTQNAVMIPLYTDFRLNLGQPTSVGFFIDMRVGAGFYISDKWILVGDGYVNSSTSFYLKPAIGVRVPVSKNNPKLAVNLSATYQLLTNSYWYSPGGGNSITLNSLGLNVGFEW